jgi:lysophospholipase L1-like esterase
MRIALKTNASRGQDRCGGTNALAALAVSTAAYALGASSFQPLPSTVPAAREDPAGIAREAIVIERARTSPPVPFLFIGDSITQSWEDEGSAVWSERIAPLSALNLGVSGDRTEHVLWRLGQAPISRLNPKAVVLLIGTNNVGGGRDDAAATLAGVREVIRLVRAQAPTATVIVCGILPRGERMNAMRGELLQVNQALAREFGASCDTDTPLPAGGGVRFIDFGVRFIDADGKIPPALMPDALHLSPAGYSVWADAVLPALGRRGA